MENKQLVSDVASQKLTFLGIKGDPAKARFVVMSDSGSVASDIIAASNELEDYDIETNSRLRSVFSGGSLSPESIGVLFDEKRIPVLLGEDAGISIPAFRAIKKSLPSASILQISPHAALRPNYDGRDNHPLCVMARARECSPSVVQWGISNVANREKDLIDYEKTFVARDINRGLGQAADVIDELTSKVYITLNTDILDPWGVSYDAVLDLIKKVAKERDVIGFDVIASNKGLVRLAAHFVVKCMVYM